MSQALLTSRSVLGLVTLLVLTAFGWLGTRPTFAAHPAPRTVVLKAEDWKKSADTPITSTEIDALVTKELKASQIIPAAMTTDEEFLRRVTLDLTGQLPNATDVLEFIANTDTDKRTKKIDQLLESKSYARHWARFWRDVVTARKTNRRSMGLTRSFEEWMYEQLRAEKNWGEITRSILTAEGELRFSQTLAVNSKLKPAPGWQERPTTEGGELFFLVAHDTDEPEQRAAETSRVFLGIQIQCAQCHDHFTEPWKRTQFHELAAYFSRTKYEQLFVDKKLVGVQLVTLPDKEHKMVSLEDPDSSTLIHPRYLDGRSPGVNLSDRERRQSLAEIITDKQNHWFAAAYVNRVWCEMLGQSFYENVDDLGPQKSVVFPELLTRLTSSFQSTDYDIKTLFRAIANSQTYQRQTRMGASPGEHLNFAAAYPARLRADTLWASLVHVLGNVEHGSRFLTKGGVRFNKSFQEGKFQAEFDFDPSLRREEVEGTLPQALMMMNNPALNKRIQAGRTTLLGQLLKEHENDSEAITAVYLQALARRPTDGEMAKCSAYITHVQDRAEAFEDILWALINSTEFQTKR